MATPRAQIVSAVLAVLTAQVTNAAVTGSSTQQRDSLPSLNLALGRETVETLTLDGGGERILPLTLQVRARNGTEAVLDPVLEKLESATVLNAVTAAIRAIDAGASLDVLAVNSAVEGLDVDYAGADVEWAVTYHF